MEVLNYRILSKFRMSIYYRKEFNREKWTLKNLNLNMVSRNLVNILPANCTFEDYFEAFKKYYPYIWDDIIAYCQSRRNNYYRRKRKHLRTVGFESPVQFLKHHTKIKKNKRAEMTEMERSQLRRKLASNARKKLKARKNKLVANLVYVQKTCPGYIKEMISAYFDIRKKDTLNINARYLILLEASHFKCKETISFLEKVNACDKNDDLRLMAFYALQRLGEHPWLARRRKGKKKLTSLRPIDIIKNPSELLKLLYENQQLLYQHYDVFLSHSSKDVNELLTLKASLNSVNKTVYIDWVNDREMLNRENQNEDTWNAIEERMRQSDVLLYVMTDNSIQSPCTEREVKYFKQQNKRILIYQPHVITLPKPEYLVGCENCDVVDGIPVI